MKLVENIPTHRDSDVGSFRKTVSEQTASQLPKTFDFLLYLRVIYAINYFQCQLLVFAPHNQYRLGQILSLPPVDQRTRRFSKRL